MKKLIPILGLLLLPLIGMADTPPPGTVKAKMYSGDGNTAVTTQNNGALNVNITGGSGLTSTVNQGAAGASAWLAAITTSVLPTNACQETGGHLASIDTKLTSPLAVTGTFFQATQPVSGTLTCNAGTGTFAVSAASLPLPTNAATSALQTTGNTSLATIATNTANAGTPVVTGTVTANAGTNLNTSALALESGGHLSSIDLKTPSLGQALAAGSVPVVLTTAQLSALVPLTTVSVNYGSGTFPVSGTFWQTTQPISAASLPLPTLAATSTLQTTGNSSLSSIDSKVPTLGQAVSAASVPVVLPAAQITTLTPPTSVTVTQATGTNLHAVIDSGSVTATISGTPNVAVTSSVLPTGAASAANQSTEISSLATIATNTTNAGTPTVSGTVTANLGTLNGASTAANQATGNTSLSSIDSKTPGLGQALAASSSPVVLPAAQITALTPPTSVTVTQATGTNLHTVVDSAPTTAVTQSGTWTVGTQAVSGATDSQTTGTVSTVITLTAPANAQGFFLQNLQTSTANLRFAMGATATTALGMQLAPGQDSGFVPTSANVSLVSESGTQNYNIQWIAK